MKNNNLKILLTMCFAVTSLSAKAVDTDEAFISRYKRNKEYCCQKYEKGSSREIDLDLTKKETSYDKSSENVRLVSQIHYMRNFDEDSEKIYKDAVAKLVVALNSQSFKDQLLDLKDLTETEIKGTELKPKDILEILMSGLDSTNLKEDHDIDIDVTLYYNRWSKVIGYSQPPRTWVNEKYLKKMTVNELAGHILHEYLHNVGFTHYKEHSTSVPYQLGYLATRVLNTLYQST